MKRVALFVVAAYAALFIQLTWLVFIGAFFNIKDFGPMPDVSTLQEALSPYLSLWYWLFIGSLLLCQAGLLLIPVRIARQRPVSKRSVYIPIIVAGFLVGALVLGLSVAIYEVLKIKGMPDWAGWVALGCCVAIWIAWSLVFCRLSSGKEPKGVVLKQCSYLLRASALTFLVAVPCHIFVRHRNDCCAGFFTFVGLVFGLAVMLLSFGPSVYFLYAERWRKLHPEKYGCLLPSHAEGSRAEEPEGKEAGDGMEGRV